MMVEKLGGDVFMKRILICLLAVVLVLSFIGCSNINTMKRIKDTNKIIWGTNAAFAPFEMRQGDKVIGIDAEIAQRIADKLGVELVVEDMEFEALMSALKSGKIDFIAAGFTNATTGDFVASEIEGAQVERYNNGMEAVMDLKNGNIDAVIIDNLPAQLLAEKNPEVKILDEKPAENEEYALAVRKGDTELQKVINEVLKEMKESGEIEELVNKYSIGE
jgi:polar amino acid transport system substrate-binding protein